MSEVRGGVYPFCKACTASSVPWRTPDTTTGLNGRGTRFYGHSDVCLDCGSSVRTLFTTFLLVPISRLGRYRIIKTGGRSYVGRKVPDQPMPAPVKSPTPEQSPPSDFKNHPELVDANYEQAERHWAARDSAGALPLYEKSLAACERVLMADDPATLQVRLRVAQVRLAIGDYGAAIPWFELVTPQLEKVFGPDHKLTRLAIEAITGAQLMVGGPREEVQLLSELLTHDEMLLGRQDPKVLRTRSALGRAHMFAEQLSRAVQVLEMTVADSIEGLGVDHPDTEVYRGRLQEVCEQATIRGRKKDRDLAAAARRRWALV